MTAAFWTKEQDEKLASLYQTHTSAAIGEIMGRTESAIIARLNKLGLRRPQLKLKAKAPLHTYMSGEMRDALTASAKARGVTVGTIVRVLIAREYGLSTDGMIIPEGRVKKTRRPRAKIVSNQLVERPAPSMPFVPIGRD